MCHPATRTSHEQLLQIEREYLSTNESLTHICQRHNANQPNVYRRLVRRGVKMGRRTRYTYTDFFKSVDTEEKAYVLGFWYADGNVHVSKRGQLTARIAVAQKDRAIIEKMRDLMCPDAPVATQKRAKRGIANSQPLVSLSVTQPAMAQDLIRLGCTPRKTYDIAMPRPDQVPPHLMRHFIRGFIDGDGCISLGYRKTAPIGSVIIVCSHSFGRNMRELIHREVGVRTSWSDHSKTNVVGYIRVNGNRQVLKFIDYLYEGATIWLDRKRSKAEQFKKEYREHVPVKPTMPQRDPTTGRLLPKTLWAA